MRRIFFWVSLMVLAGAGVLHAQISQPGTPAGFSALEELPSVSFVDMPPVDNAQLMAEDAVQEAREPAPWRFGENLALALDPANSGSWHTLENGDRLWRLGLRSPGAYSLNLTFDRFRLPPGAELYVYSPDGEHILGAFTEANNQESGYFATTLVPGDELIVEYVEPVQAPLRGELRLQTLTHAYRDPFAYAKGFGDSGWCNLNVACEEAEGWDNQVNSVVMLLTGSNGFCTGVLLNNTRNDAAPYLLSANHCFRDPSTVVAWFNWQSESCENPETAPPYQSMNGAATLARNASSDFWLMRFNQDVPLEYGAYYAGWNRTLTSSLSGTVAGIHHPRGDIKKFSYAEGGVEAARYLGNAGSGNTHWRVVWSGGTTTEPASSGSPIFDPNGYVIGQLHGGYAACGNTLPDWYGRFGISWDGGGSPETRLRDWLDPLGLNPSLWDGYEPVDYVRPVAFFDALVLDKHSIQLSWEANDNQDMVMIATAPGSVFGEPAGPYALGTGIDGGGRVIYLGTGDSLMHEPLDHATEYHYAIWSFSEELEYSEPLFASAETPAPVIRHFPHHEAFEEARVPPAWKQVPTAGNLWWRAGQGNDQGAPPGTFSGQTNLFFRASAGQGAGSTRLITPLMDLSDFDAASLGFHYANARREGQLDLLVVHYRLSPGSDWQLLAALGLHRPDWTGVLLEIPQVSDSLQVAFEAIAQGGHGICLDAVEIKGTTDMVFPAPVALTAEAGPSWTQLRWQAPVRSDPVPELTGYEVLRNGRLVIRIPDPLQTSLRDENLPVGTYEYVIKALYKRPEGSSAPSTSAVARITAGETTHALELGVEGQGLTEPLPGVYIYNQGVNVFLTATPLPLNSFMGWEEGGNTISSHPVITLPMDRNRSLTAMFEKTRYALDLKTQPVGAGLTRGEGLYLHGETLEVYVNPHPGYRFRYWKEAERILSTAPAFPWTVTAPAVMTAYFSPRLFEVRLAVEPSGGGEVIGEGVYQFGQEATIQMNPEKDFVFVRWKEGERTVSLSNPYTFMVSRDVELTGVVEGATSIEWPGDQTLSARDGSPFALRVHPVPADNWLRVETQGLTGPARLTIHDPGGRLWVDVVSGADGFPSRMDLSLTRLPPGLYLLQVAGQAGTVVRRIVRQ